MPPWRDRGDQHEHRQTDEEQPAAEERRRGAVDGDEMDRHDHPASATNDRTAPTSKIRPFVRSGPRITAYGRQTKANAEPSSRPPARVTVLR